MSNAVLKKTYQFKDLLLLTKDGEWGPDAPADDAVPMYLIRGTDFDDVRYGKLNDVPVRYVKSGAADLKTLRPNDVLLETAGGTRDQPTGRSVFLKKSLFTKATHKICCASFSRFLRFNPELVCPEYMYWWLQAKYLDGTSYEYHVQHTGVARFQYTQFAKSVSVECPSLSEQKAIAAILGALDDKIELNRRTNATLEVMARALFKSWFVDFDPVRAKMEGRQPFGMDSETATLFPSSFQDDGIPEGWEVLPLKEAVSFFNSKRIPLSSRERAERKGAYRYFGATSVMDHVDDYLFDGIYVLVGEDGSVATEQGLPFLQYVWGKFWVNNHAHILQGKNGWSAEALYLLLAQSNVQHLVTGAVQPKLSMGNLGRLAFTNPSGSILDNFCSKIAPLFSKRRALCDEISSLEKLRDYLLPKLISGDIRIPDAEQFVEAV